MVVRTLILVFLAASGFIGRLAAAQDVRKSGGSLATITFCLCIDPPNFCAVSCTNKGSCRECKQWKELVFGRHDYSYEKGVPRANWFLDDAATKIYGEGLAKSDVGHPVTFSELYQDPEKYGLAELGEDQPKNGSLIVWPSIGGLAVTRGAEIPQTEGEKTLGIAVLYPSDKKKGELAFTDPKYLGEGEKPKYLVPQGYLQKFTGKP